MSKVFDKIREKAGSYFLNKELSKTERSPKVYNYTDATKIGILYKVVDDKMYQSVKQFVKHLKEEEGIRKIMALGYVDEKEVPYEYQSKLEFDYFCRKELNKFGKPGGITVNNFIEEEYDILIDLTIEQCLPLRFVLLNSQARFKVGLYSEENQSYFDMMLSIDQLNNIEQLIQSINHYLSIINTGDGKQV